MFISTNKATLSFRKGIVEKIYFVSGSALRDYLILVAIRDGYTPTIINEMNYRPLKMLSYDSSREALQMENFQGITIQEAFINSQDVKYFKYMGRWLGVMHRQALHKDHPPAFRDFNTSNVMCNEKEVVAFDPGGWENLYENKGLAFVIGAFSVWRCCLIYNRKAVYKALRSYLHGYISVANRLTLLNWGKGGLYLVKRMYKRQTKVFMGHLAPVRIVSIMIEVLCFFTFIILAKLTLVLK